MGFGGVAMAHSQKIVGRHRGGHALTRAFWYAAAAARNRTCPPLTMRFARSRDAISTRVVATRQALWWPGFDTSSFHSEQTSVFHY